MKYCVYDFCDFKTEKGTTMSMHVSMNHSKDKKHKCPDPECNRQFAVKTQLLHHFVNHHCEADIPCGFKGCNFLFKTTTTQRMHYVRAHLKHKNLFTSSFMKGYKTCLTCSKYLKSANMIYHVAQCSTDSPFCTNVAAMEKKKIDKGIDELAALSDGDDDFWGEKSGEPAEAAGVAEMEEDEDFDRLLGRVLSD